MCNKSAVSEGLSPTDVLFQMNNDRHDLAIQSFSPHVGSTYHVQSLTLAAFPVPHLLGPNCSVSEKLTLRKKPGSSVNAN